MANSKVLKNKGNLVTWGYKKGTHNGIDVVGTGSTLDYIVAHSDGTVVQARNNYATNDSTGGSYGNYVLIKHTNGYYTLYAHMRYNSVTVKVGQTVKKGQVIGYMGNTGYAFGAHLHFEVRDKNNIMIDPTAYINADLPDNSSNTNPEIDHTGIITYQAYTDKWLEEVNKCDNTDNGYAGIGSKAISGFRCKPQNGEIIYEAHQKNGKWLGAVNSKDYKKNDLKSISSYAGIYGHDIDAIRIKSTKGYVDYRVKTKEDGWLPWVRGFGDKDNEFAGIYGHTIIGIQMK